MIILTDRLTDTARPVSRFLRLRLAFNPVAVIAAPAERETGSQAYVPHTRQHGDAAHYLFEKPCCLRSFAILCIGQAQSNGQYVLCVEARVNLHQLPKTL